MSAPAEPDTTSSDQAEHDRAGHDRVGHDQGSAPRGCGLALRLVETEGRPVRARLRCFRTPSGARQRDFTGNTICELTTDGDAVLVDLTAFEIADIEIQFD